MGLVHHHASISPTKQELAESWLPSRSWAQGRAITKKIAEYRFDDPAGEVGVETILWSADDGSVLQIPFTYRDAPLEGAEEHLIDTMEHTVLGKRWVYDGCGDPVWAQTLTAAILTGGTQAQMFIEEDGQQVDVPPRMQVRGSGTEGAAVPVIAEVEDVRDDGELTVVTASGVRLTLARVVGASLEGDRVLRGSIGDRDGLVLATASL